MILKQLQSTTPNFSPLQTPLPRTPLRRQALLLPLRSSSSSPRPPPRTGSPPLSFPGSVGK